MKKVSAPSGGPGKGGKSILVAYFSHSGNTRVIAHQIHEIVGGDIFEIVPVDPYPHNYDEVVEQARKELSEDYRPKLKTKVGNMESYNVVFIGHPNWWGTIPRPVATFLSEYDLSGKTIVPFCTHEGSGLGRSVTDVRELCPRSTVLDGQAIRGSGVKNAQDEVSGWLREIGMNKGIMNPCKGCEYRQIFPREENEGKIVFCRKFNCERDDARSKCERWKGILDPSV